MLKENNDASSCRRCMRNKSNSSILDVTWTRDSFSVANKEPGYDHVF